MARRTGSGRVLGILVVLLASGASAAGPIEAGRYLGCQTNHPYNRLLWRPSDGSGKQSRWFEWWYYKVVLPETGQAFFWTYGVVNPRDPENRTGDAKAFVSFGDFGERFLIENEFPVTAFTGSKESSAVEIGQGNYSDGEALKGAVADGAHSASWDLRIGCDWSFNAMSWSVGIHHLSNIFWYPVQASARMTGTLTVDGRVHDLVDAPAYQDRNWGRSFPRWWTWIVSNQFEGSPGTVLAVGGGRPRVLSIGPSFEGLAIGLRHQGREFSFRSNELSRIKMDISFGRWEVDARNDRGERIVISARAEEAEFMDLPFETPEGEVFHDLEALTGEVTVRLFEKRHGKWRLLEQLYSPFAGIEYGAPGD